MTRGYPDAAALEAIGYVIRDGRAYRPDAGARLVPTLPQGGDERARALREIAATTREPVQNVHELPPKPNKYHARKTPGLGPNGEPRTYDSKAEARFANLLNERRAAGLIRAWVPQVSLPCGVDEQRRDIRYRADAMEILALHADGTFTARLLDRKGMDTPTSRAKRGALRAATGLSVEVVS